MKEKHVYEVNVYRFRIYCITKIQYTARPRGSVRVKLDIDMKSYFFTPELGFEKTSETYSMDTALFIPNFI